MRGRLVVSIRCLCGHVHHREMMAKAPREAACAACTYPLFWRYDGATSTRYYAEGVHVTQWWSCKKLPAAQRQSKDPK